MTNNNKINEEKCNELVHIVDRHLQQHRSNGSAGLPREMDNATQSYLCGRLGRERRRGYDPSPVRRRIPQAGTPKASCNEEDVYAQSL